MIDYVDNEFIECIDFYLKDIDLIYLSFKIFISACTLSDLTSSIFFEIDLVIREFILKEIVLGTLFSRSYYST